MSDERLEPVNDAEAFARDITVFLMRMGMTETTPGGLFAFFQQNVIPQQQHLMAAYASVPRTADLHFRLVFKKPSDKIAEVLLFPAQLVKETPDVERKAFYSALGIITSPFVFMSLVVAGYTEIGLDIAPPAGGGRGGNGKGRGGLIVVPR